MSITRVMDITTPTHVVLGPHATDLVGGMVWTVCTCAIYISLTGYVMYFYSCVFDCVLLAVGRNYTANIIGRTAARQIPPIYNDLGIVVRVDNGLCFEYPFPVSTRAESFRLCKISFISSSSSFTLLCS